MIVVNSLPGMTPRQVAEEVRRSIAFGSPVVTFLWVLDDTGPGDPESDPDQL